MGLIDEILGKVVSSALGGNQSQQSANPLGALINSLGGGNQAQGGNMLAAAMSLLQENGGLSGVLDMFRGKGMTQEADSWVGTGPNVGVSADQVKQVFGGSTLSNLATQMGTSQSQTSSVLAQILPELINTLTPEGQVPENHDDLISQGLSLLRRGAA